MEQPRTAAGTWPQTDTPLASAWKSRGAAVDAPQCRRGCAAGGQGLLCRASPEGGQCPEALAGAQGRWPGWAHCIWLQSALHLGFLAAHWGPLLGTCCVQVTFTVSPRLSDCREGSSWANQWRSEFWVGNCAKWFGLARLVFVCPRPRRKYALCLVGPRYISLRAAGRVRERGGGPGISSRYQCAVWT